MRYLIVSATAAEISPFLKDLKTSQNPNWEKHEIDVLVTGVGVLNSTWSITKQVLIKRPEFVVQAGIAGSFGEKLPIGSVVQVSHDKLGDLGVLEKGKFQDQFQLGLAEPNKYPYTRGWLVNKSMVPGNIRLRKVRGVTINEISTSAKRLEYLQNKLGAALESMEGASLHYICLMENIPFLQLRAISNIAGERNKKKWKMDEAIINLNKELVRVLNQ